MSAHPPPHRTPGLGAVILCGGLSTRLGMNKTDLQFKAQSFLERIAEEVGFVCSPIVLVGDVRFEQHRLPKQAILASDERPGNGPLEGIRVGLKRLANQVDYAFVTSCDVPLIKSQLISHLAELRGNQQAVIPHDGTRIYGMTAIYPTSLHEQIGQQIERGQLRVSELGEICSAQNPHTHSFREIDPHLHSITNINSAKDYRALLKQHGLECSPEIDAKLNEFRK